MAFENRPKDFFAKQIRSSHLIASGGIIDPESSDWDEQLPHLRLMIYPRDSLEVESSTGATEYIDGAFEGIIPPTLLNDVEYNDDGQVVGGSGLKVGQDVWLFVSGAQGTTHTDLDGDGELELSEMERRSDHGVVLFGGDVVISGTLFAERQVIEVDLSHEGQLFVSGNLRAQDYERDLHFVQFRSPGYREDVQYPDLWMSGEAAMLTHSGSHANPKMWETSEGILTAEEAGYTGFYAPAGGPTPGIDNSTEELGYPWVDVAIQEFTSADGGKLVIIAGIDPINTPSENYTIRFADNGASFTQVTSDGTRGSLVRVYTNVASSIATIADALNAASEAGSENFAAWVVAEGTITAADITAGGNFDTVAVAITAVVGDAEVTWASANAYDNKTLSLGEHADPVVVGLPDADGTVLNLTTTNSAFSGPTAGDALDDPDIAGGVRPYYTVEQLNAAITIAGGAIFANRNDAIEKGAGFLAFNPGDTTATSTVIFNIDSIHEQVGINTHLPAAALDVRRRQIHNNAIPSVVDLDGAWSTDGNEQVTFLLHADDQIGHGAVKSNPLASGSQSSPQHDDVSFYVWGAPDSKANFNHAVPGSFQKSVAGFGGDVVISGTLYTENGMLVVSSFHDTITGDEITDNSTMPPGPLGTIQFEATETAGDGSGIAAKIEVEAGSGDWATDTTPARLNFYTSPNASQVEPDLRMTITHDGDIGIGTEDPDAQLEVVQGPNTDTALRLSYEKTVDGTAASVYADVKVDISGHLNITPTGDTARLISDGDTVFQIQSTSDGDTSLQFDVTGDGTSNWTLGIDNGDSDKLKIDYGASVGSNTAITVLSDLNVGIGTSTPVNKLDVYGASAIGSSYAGALSAPADGAIIEGAVGIGVTAPAAKLDVKDTGEQLRLKNTDSDIAKFTVDSNGDLTIDASGNDVKLTNGDSFHTDTVRALGVAGLQLHDDGGNGIFIEDGGFVGINEGNPEAQLHVEGLANTSPDDAPFWPLTTPTVPGTPGSWGPGDSAPQPLRLVGLKEDNTDYHPDSDPSLGCLNPKVLVAGPLGDVMYTEAVMGKLGQDRDGRYYEGDKDDDAVWPGAGGTPWGDDTGTPAPGTPYDNGYIVPTYDGATTPQLLSGWNGDTQVGHAIDDLNHGLREVDENNAWEWENIDGVTGGDIVYLKDMSNNVGMGTSNPTSKIHMATLEGGDIDVKIEASELATDGSTVHPAPIARLEFSFDSQHWIDNGQAERAEAALTLAAITRDGWAAHEIVDGLLQNGREAGDIVLSTQHSINVIDGFGNPINDPGTGQPFEDDGSIAPIKIKGDTERERTQVLILSGTTTLVDPGAPNPRLFNDVNFFVSGSIGSAATAAVPLGDGHRGASCFGGDVVISGTLYASNIVPTSTVDMPNVLYMSQKAKVFSLTLPGGVAAGNTVTFPGSVLLHPFAGVGDDFGDGGTTPTLPPEFWAVAYKNRLQVHVNGQQLAPDEYIIDGSGPRNLKFETDLHAGDHVLVNRIGDPNDWFTLLHTPEGFHLADMLDFNDSGMSAGNTIIYSAPTAASAGIVNNQNAAAITITAGTNWVGTWGNKIKIEFVVNDIGDGSASAAFTGTSSTNPLTWHNPDGYAVQTGDEYPQLLITYDGDATNMGANSATMIAILDAINDVANGIGPTDITAAFSNGTDAGNPAHVLSIAAPATDNLIGGVDEEWSAGTISTGNIGTRFLTDIDDDGSSQVAGVAVAHDSAHVQAYNIEVPANPSDTIELTYTLPLIVNSSAGAGEIEIEAGKFTEFIFKDEGGTADHAQVTVKIVPDAAQSLDQYTSTSPLIIEQQYASVTIYASESGTWHII